MQAQASVQPSAEALASAVGGVDLPIGWDGKALAETRKLLGFPDEHEMTGGKGMKLHSGREAAQGGANPVALVLLLAGYLATALAATLGSPFWFDLLGRFVNIRAALKPSDQARSGGKNG